MACLKPLADWVTTQQITLPTARQVARLLREVKEDLRYCRATETEVGLVVGKDIGLSDTGESEYEGVDWGVFVLPLHIWAFHTEVFFSKATLTRGSDRLAIAQILIDRLDDMIPLGPED